MKKYRWYIILLNLIVLLVYFNNSILNKEEILSDGKLILVELAPVDPRSLMQGDYMQLRYNLTDSVDIDSIPKRGFCVVKLNGAIAKAVRFQEGIIPKEKGEYLIEYTRSSWRVNIGAESYFFEEGQAKKYEEAEYGGIMVDDKGNSILVALYDDEENKIE